MSYLDDYPVMPTLQRGWLNYRLAVGLFIGFIALFFFVQIPSCSEIGPSWIFGQSKQELKVENTELRNQVDTVVAVNENNVTQKEEETKVVAAIETTIKENKVATEVKVAEVKKVKTVTEKKIRVIEKSTELTEQQKDKQVASAVADSIWTSFCSVDVSNSGCSG